VFNDSGSPVHAIIRFDSGVLQPGARETVRDLVSGAEYGFNGANMTLDLGAEQCTVVAF